MTSDAPSPTSGLNAEARLDFMVLPEQDRLDLVKHKKPVVLTIPTAVAHLGEIESKLPDTGANDGLEIPPMLGALEDASAFQIYGQSSEDAAGAWMRFVVFVYRHGGRIHYRRLNGVTLSATLSF
jgi:hypothetical protein